MSRPTLHRLPAVRALPCGSALTSPASQAAVTPSWGWGGAAPSGQEAPISRLVSERSLAVDSARRLRGADVEKGVNKRTTSVEDLTSPFLLTGRPCTPSFYAPTPLCSPTKPAPTPCNPAA